MPFKGWWGGFFRDLGTAGGATVIMSAIVSAFVHSYISNKIAESQGLEPGSTKPELYTAGAMGIPALAYGVASAMGKVPDTDATNIIGNMFGGMLVWESANLVETMITMLEGGGSPIA